MNLSVHDLIEMKKIIASAILISTGQFHEELNRISVESAKLDEKLGLLKGVEDLETRRAEVAKELEAKEKVVCSREERAKGREKANELWEKGLTERAALLLVQEGDMAARLSALQTRENECAAMQEKVKRGLEELKEKEDKSRQALVDRENKVKEAEAALAARIARLAEV